jgi:Na+/proline symporter
VRPLDWVVLATSIVVVVVYGVWKGRGSRNIEGYLLANRGMRWWAVGLSIMATQASAITFLSTPGQAYVDGMRFVQFYFGLPIAMVILSVTAVPIYHRLKVFTAYEYLETRFDMKTRALASLLFLTQRGLAAGLTIFAPALILSVILGWNLHITIMVIGAAVIIYTTAGGTRAVNYTHIQQMIIIAGAMVTVFFVILLNLPDGVGLGDATFLTGKMGRLNAIDLSFDLNNRYTLWSGLIGGLFLALSYFGTDQSQVQRYLTGSSIAQSRLGLLFNGLVKVPMQFFILFLGVMVFAFYQFTAPPLFFNSIETAEVRESPYADRYAELEAQYETAFQRKAVEAMALVEAGRTGDPRAVLDAEARLSTAEQQLGAVREAGIGVLQQNHPGMDTSDTNYIFLTFVTRYLPAGLVGLVIAAIFAASMSSTSGELNALASTTVIDIYRRLIRKDASPRHYLIVSKVATAMWGVYAIIFAGYASRLGALIEAVNILGSLFYGTILGIFMVAFFVKRVGGTATFVAALVAEALVVLFFLFSGISYLWYNVIGCLATMGLAMLLQPLLRKPARTSPA